MRWVRLVEEVEEEGEDVEVEVLWLHPHQSHSRSTRRSISSWQVWQVASAVPWGNQAATRRRPYPDAFLSGVKQSSQGNSNGGHSHPPIRRPGGSVDQRVDQRHRSCFNVWAPTYCVIGVGSGDITVPRRARRVLGSVARRGHGR